MIGSTETTDILIEFKKNQTDQDPIFNSTDRYDMIFLMD